MKRKGLEKLRIKKPQCKSKKKYQSDMAIVKYRS